MLENCDGIVVFLIYGQFGAIWKPDFRRIVCKPYTLIKSNHLSYKNWKQNSKISNTSLTQLLWEKWYKLTYNAEISKIKRTLVLKGI